MVYWFISRKIIIFQDSRGGPAFSRGSNFFEGGGGPIANSYKTYRTCDFPGMVGTPCLPLWIRACTFFDIFLSVSSKPTRYIG